MNLLTVKNLFVRFNQRTIVEGVSFELAPKERLSILGPNGSGKTVLLKALLNLIPYTGEISWATDVRLGYVPQKIDADVHLPLTFSDLFVAKCRTLGVPTDELDHISSIVGLAEDVMATPVGHVSGGQFQRGLIGFALIGRPNVLILDEPTASIDEPGEEHIYQLIHRLQDEYGLTSIMVSHDLSFVFRYATKVLCLNRRNLCIGVPQDVLTPETMEKLYGQDLAYYEHDHSSKMIKDHHEQ